MQLWALVQPGLKRAILSVEGGTVKRGVMHIRGKRDEREVSLQVLHAA
jgi:hypothetical protein